MMSEYNSKREFDCFGELLKTKAGYININLEGNNRYLSDALDVSKEISLGTDKTISKFDYPKEKQEPKFENKNQVSSGRCTI